MNLVLEIVTLPAAWAEALIYGDASGLHADDVANLSAWRAAHPGLMIGATHTDDAPRFTWSYRLYGGTAQGGEVCDYIAYSRVIAEPR